MEDFRDKVAIITGASGGIGFGLARRAVQLGMKVILADIDDAKLEECKRALKAEGASVIAKNTDVSDADQVQDLANTATAAFGAIDVVFNNAGVLVDGKSWQRSVQDWEWIIGVNLWGVIHGVNTFIPIMLEQGTPCHMVNTASQAGLTVGPYLAPYNVTKQGVVALTETLHHELAAQSANVKVSVLCPGVVDTDIWHSEMYRPVSLGRSLPLQSEEEKTYRDVVSKGVAAGMPPEELANVVFDAIEKEQFWIFPHPEMLPTFEKRSKSIMTQSNPDFSGISESVRGRIPRDKSF